MKEVTYSGVGFCDLLCIVFIVLKLLGIITWSWLWVLCPIWIPAIFIIIIAIISAAVSVTIGR